MLDLAFSFFLVHGILNKNTFAIIQIKFIRAENVFANANWTQFTSPHVKRNNNSFDDIRTKFKTLAIFCKDVDTVKFMSPHVDGKVIMKVLSLFVQSNCVIISVKLVIFQIILIALHNMNIVDT